MSVSRNDLSGRVAVVTGAASGIGRSISDLLTESGAKVFEIDLKYEPFSKDKKTNYPVKFQANLVESRDVQKALDLVRKMYGRLDILVNSAGIEMSGNVVDLPEESFDRVMDSNVKSIFLMCKYSVPLILMTSSHGSIINISSDLGIQPIPNTDAYAASKGAIISMTKALSKNWAKQGLRVNCIAPGPIDTPLLHRFQSDQILNFVKDTLIPMGRLGTPEDVAKVALFLASDESSYVNGAVFTVNGGLVG